MTDPGKRGRSEEGRREIKIFQMERNDLVKNLKAVFRSNLFDLDFIGNN